MQQAPPFIVQRRDRPAAIPMLWPRPQDAAFQTALTVYQRCHYSTDAFRVDFQVLCHLKCHQRNDTVFRQRPPCQHSFCCCCGPSCRSEDTSVGPAFPLHLMYVLFERCLRPAWVQSHIGKICTPATVWESCRTRRSGRYPATCAVRKATSEPSVYPPLHVDARCCSAPCLEDDHERSHASPSLCDPATPAREDARSFHIPFWRVSVWDAAADARLHRLQVLTKRSNSTPIFEFCVC
jgi:hypothetical protein